MTNQTITNHEPKEVREAGLNSKVSRFREWLKLRYPEIYEGDLSFVVLKSDYLDYAEYCRQQAIEETVEKIRTIVMKQRGIGSMTTKGVTDYISRPKLLSELKSIK